MTAAPAADALASTEHVLDVTDLSLTLQTRRGDLNVLRHVSLTIAPGEIVGLVGESGSGKSVLSMAVVRLLPSGLARLDSGEILVGGVSTSSATEAAMHKVRGSRVGFIFQEPMSALNPSLTIGTQIALAIRRHRGGSRRAVRREAVEALDQVRIKNAAAVARQYPHELSGGMRQRVVIAIALAGRPSLLIADEPTTALDVSVQAEILDLIRDRAVAHGCAVLFVSHDLGVVYQLCQRVYVLYGGEIVESGPTESLVHHPAHPYTHALLGALPSTAGGGRLTPIPGRPPDPAEPPRGCVFEDRCQHRFDRCHEKPPLVAVTAERQAACWLLEDGSRRG